MGSYYLFSAEQKIMLKLFCDSILLIGTINYYILIISLLACHGIQRHWGICSHEAGL